MRILILFLFLFSSLAFAGNNFSIKSYKQEFIKFLSEAHDLPFEDQKEIWQRIFDSQDAQVFIDTFGWEGTEQRNNSLAAAFPFYFTHQDIILAQFNDFEENIPPLLDKFSKLYPQVDLAQVEIIAMPSHKSFNGKMWSFKNGRKMVMLGMDFLAANKAAIEIIPGMIIEDDVQVLLSHELGHAIHLSLADYSYENPLTGTLLFPLWKEGLAQAISWQMNPDKAKGKILMDKVVAKYCQEEYLPSFAKAFLADLENPDIMQTYKQWFKISFKTTPQIPATRLGYCLGLEAVIELNKNYQLEEMMQWSLEESSEALSTYLKRLSE